MFEAGLLALGLGIKHSMDADHLIGVSNLLTKSRSILHTVKLSISWAAGHMVTATLITLFLFLFRDSILSPLLGKMELGVAFMLIVLGGLSLYQSRIFHRHKHLHEERKHAHVHIHLKTNSADHSHRHMFGVGIVHGLASNDELLWLLTVTLGLSSLTDMITGVAVFSIGVILGMVLFSIFLTYPLLKMGDQKLNQVVHAVVGTISIVYGFSMLLGAI